MIDDLFASDEGSRPIICFDMPDADVSLYPSLYSNIEADLLFNELKEVVEWEVEEIAMYGQKYKLPRLTAWYGDKGKTYTYSGITSCARPWNDCLLKIKNKIETGFQVSFNSVLINFYRSEHDSVSWHSDDEYELGPNPVIGSVSLGQPRTFQMKHKSKAGEKRNIELGHGDFLLMKGSTQHFWQHQIPKRKKLMKERINLTFRRVI